MKYLAINLTKYMQNMYVEIYKVLKKKEAHKIKKIKQATCIFSLFME